MLILSPDVVAAYLRISIETNVEKTTIDLFEQSAASVVSQILGWDVMAPNSPVPESVKIAMMVLMSCNYDDRLGGHRDAMETVRRLCAPHAVGRL